MQMQAIQVNAFGATQGVVTKKYWVTRSQRPHFLATLLELNIRYKPISFNENEDEYHYEVFFSSSGALDEFLEVLRIFKEKNVR